MADPWDIPPYPLVGDDDEDWTYAGVGRVICTFETLEVKLAQLHSIFVVGEIQSDTMRMYGAGRIFAERIQTLVDAAEKFFQGCPHQAREGTFAELARRSRGWAGRRNDVAHGMVREFNHIWRYIHPGRERPNDGKQRYCLLPSSHTERRFNAANQPEYVYTSQELLKFEEAIQWTWRDVEEFAGAMSRD